MAQVGAQIPRWGPHIEAPGMLALWQRHTAGEIDYVAADHGLVVAMTPIERRQTRLAGRNGPVHLAPAGSVNVIPAGADHWGCWGDDKESLYFALAPERLRTAAAIHYDDDRVELTASTRPHVDVQLLRFADLLRRELRDGGLMTELYADSLGSLIMVHLLRHYSTLGEAHRPARRGGLAPSAKRAVLDYMADRCREPLSIAELAGVAGLAPSSFLRSFRQEVGVTPHRHLLRLRIARAETLLRDGDLSLAAIALATGFSSQSHMTTAFARLTGRTPGAARRTAAREPFASMRRS